MFSNLVQVHSFVVADLFRTGEVSANGRISVKLNILPSATRKNWYLKLSLSKGNQTSVGAVPVPDRVSVGLFSDDAGQELLGFVDVRSDGALSGNDTTEFMRGCWSLLVCKTTFVVTIYKSPALVVTDRFTEKFVSATPFDVFVVLRNVDYSHQSSFSSVPMQNAAGQKGIWMHKAALCAISDVFRTMFATNMLEQTTGVVTLTQQYREACGIDVLTVFCTMVFLSMQNGTISLPCLRRVFNSILLRGKDVAAQHIDKRRRLIGCEKEKDYGDRGEKPVLPLPISAVGEEGIVVGGDTSGADNVASGGVASVSTTERFIDGVRIISDSKGPHFSLATADDRACASGHIRRWEKNCADCATGSETFNISWRCSLIFQDHLETIWFPVFDLLHQYNCKEGLRVLTIEFLASIEASVFNQYYDLANRYEIEPLQRACASFGWDMMNPRSMQTVSMWTKPWKTAQHIAFAEFVSESFDSPEAGKQPSK